MERGPSFDMQVTVKFAMPTKRVRQENGKSVQRQ